MNIRLKNISTITKNVEVNSDYIEAGYHHLATRYFIKIMDFKCIIVERYDGVAGKISVDSIRAIDAKDFNYISVISEKEFQNELDKILSAVKGE